MKKNAFIFPGQGAQYVGMGQDFANHFPICRQTFEEADDLLGESLSSIIFQGPEESLTLTKNSQLAIFVNSVAILRAVQQQLPDLKPFATAGLSLGEYTALFASGRLGFKETLFLVRERARLMNEACERTSGTMAAVLGMSPSDVEMALSPLHNVWVANYNCPGQIVISGTREGVEQGSLALKAAGAKRILPLTVHGAFHSGLMQSAQDALAPFILRAPIQESGVLLVMNAPGGFIEKTDDVRRYLTSQVTQSVRWEQGIRAMDAAGVEAYLEMGCGKTLAGMNKKIGVKGMTISIERIADLDSAAKQLEGCATCSY